MSRQGLMMLRLLVNRYHPKDRDAFLKFLPKEEVQAIANISLNSTDPTPLLDQPQQTITFIHYSWIQSTLNDLPEEQRPLFAASLTPDQIAGLKITPASPLSEISKNYLINELYKKMEADKHLPIDYLPETELSPLLLYNKSGLIDIGDFFGLHDLATEVRQIVNRNYLKNIYSCLSSKQLYYLKVCLQQKEQIVSPKLGIDPTKQDPTRLKQIIHKRGLVRLGKALCGQHPDMVWYLAHRLDIGRGSILMKEFQEKEIPKITKVLKQQVLNLMNFLNSKEKTS